MRQSKDLRFGGALLEAALADYADRQFLPAGSGTTDTLGRARPAMAGQAAGQRSPVARLWRVADSRETMEGPQEFA